MRHLRVLIAALALVACGAETNAPSAPETQAAEEKQNQPASEAVPAVETTPSPPPQKSGDIRGQPVAPRVVHVLRPDTNTVEALDLATIISKQPLAICYTLLGEPIGEEELKRFQVLADEQARAAGQLGSRIEFMGAIRISERFPVETASARLAELGITMPVIMEERLDFGRALGATSTPSISLIDAGGILRIADARNLKQEVSFEKSVSDALWHVARGGQMPTVLKLKRYYPVNDLKNKPVPDFTLTRFKGTERVTLSDHVGDGKKLTAILFWHPNCRQCKTVMPSIMAGYRAFRSELDIVSVVNIEDEFEARNTEDTIKAHGITFPVLEDENKLVTNQFFIVSTPTMIFVRPDGIVDSAYTSGNANYLPIMRARIKAVLKGTG